LWIFIYTKVYISGKIKGGIKPKAYILNSLYSLSLRRKINYHSIKTNFKYSISFLCVKYLVLIYKRSLYLF
jgi:hypothetical protein